MKIIDNCSFGDGHSFTPWVNERWKPALDTRVCRICRTYEKREHVLGTEMFPEWLHKYECDVMNEKPGTRRL